jgi:hypothetical protein
MLVRYICEDNLAFQRVDGGPRVEAFSARQHVRQADIRLCRRFHDPSQHSRWTDEQTARPTRCNCWTGLRTDGRLSAKFCTRSQGAQDGVAVHGTEARRRWWRARLPQLDASASKESSGSGAPANRALPGRVECPLFPCSTGCTIVATYGMKLRSGWTMLMGY